MTSLTDQQKKCTFSNPLDLNFVTSSFDKLIKALIVFFFPKPRSQENCEFSSV